LLRIGDVRKYRKKDQDWESQIGLARRPGQIGGVLVFAGEAPVAALRAMA